MDNLTWIIDEENVSKRIDRYLSEVCPEMSRNRIQMLIDQKYVLVNSKEIKANYKCKCGDVISLEVPENQEMEAKPENIPLDIIYEDSEILVINKPKGMVVHPSAGNWEHTLVNALLYHCKDLSGINGVLRPGIVHRIDKDTSGLLAVAKNDAAHNALANQLRDKTMNRKYLALIDGVMEHDYGTIDAPIGRDEKDRQKMTVTEKNSKKAVTHFRVVERFKDKTLVECRLETGRTHQIRVHFQYIKFPIIGDPKYGRKSQVMKSGQMLHATQLTLRHPLSGEEMTFHAPLPEEFSKILDQLRKEME